MHLRPGLCPGPLGEFPFLYPTLLSTFGASILNPQYLGGGPKYFLLPLVNWLFLSKRCFASVVVLEESQLFIRSFILHIANRCNDNNFSDEPNLNIVYQFNIAN